MTANHNYNGEKMSTIIPR